MNRRYNRWWARFEQPDPYGGSYNLGDPQSFNRYSYVQNDPVNFVDPSGLLPKCEEGRESVDPVTGEIVCVPRVDGGTVTVHPDPDLTTLMFVLNSQFSGIGINGAQGGLIPHQGRPQNPDQGPSSGEIKKDFYEKYGDIFNECLKTVFGKDAPGTQTLDNAPTLITIETSNTLKTKSKYRGHGTVVGGIDPPKNGKGGAVRIAEEIAVYYGPLSAFQFEVMMTYGHELAVLLDYRKNPKGKNGKQPGFVYGKPGSDPDTGQAIEDCMREKLNNP